MPKTDKNQQAPLKSKKSKSKLAKTRSNIKVPMVFTLLPPIQDSQTAVNARHGVTLTSPPPRRKKRKRGLGI